MQASVRRFWLLHKTINRGNGTECLLRCCSAARILHSERPAFACDCRSYGWVAQLAEQWTENPRVGGSVSPPAPIFNSCIISGFGLVSTRASLWIKIGKNRERDWLARWELSRPQGSAPFF